MARRPYLFCRFEIGTGDERLNADGQFAFFKENQGQTRTHATRGNKPDANALLMEVQDIGTDALAAVEFFIGYQPGYREKRGYNSETNTRTFAVEQDDHIKSAHVVAVPALGCMAIEDRSGENNIPQTIATRALRSIAEAALDEGYLVISHLSDAEIRVALEEWELIQYDYAIRPLNPITPSEFSVMRSDAMKLDRVAMDAGRLKPADGETMIANGGTISRTQEVVEAGYGQSGARAITPFGNEARVPKPRFHMDKAKNFEERDKPRFLKIMFNADEDGNVDSAGIAATLVAFYSPK